MIIQQNFNGSNTDGLFTTAVSNSFLSPLEKIPVADLEQFKVTFFFYIENGIMCVLIRIALNEAILMWTHNIPLC